MPSLTKIENNDGLEFHIDTDSGLAYCSISAAARMLGVDKSTISRNPVAQSQTISAEIHTTQGLRTVALLSSDQVFQLAFKYNHDLALAMGSAGANIYMLGIAGYKVQLTEQPPQTQPQRQLAPQRDLSDYIVMAEKLGAMGDPLIKSLLGQRLAEELGSKVLPATIVNRIILTVRAGELGYSQKQIGNGSQLGMFVCQRIRPLGKTQHGKYPVNVYELTEELDDCIRAYFDEII